MVPLGQGACSAFDDKVCSHRTGAERCSGDQGAFTLAARDSPDTPAYPGIGNELIQINFSEQFPPSSVPERITAHSHRSPSLSRVDTRGSAYLHQLQGAGARRNADDVLAARRDFFSPLPMAVRGGLCTEAPSPRWLRKGGQGSVVSLRSCEQAPATGLREAMGRKLRGHVVRYSLSYSWVWGFPPPVLLNTNCNHSWEGEAQGLTLVTWEHPNCMGGSSPGY